MSEKITVKNEFEKNNFHEIEKKLLPVFAENLEPLCLQHDKNELIEQYYLSHPREDFSLRVRKISKWNGSCSYTATIKSRGKITQAGVDRLEVEVEIGQDLYDYYASDDLPISTKLRHQPFPGISIDFFDDNSALVEVEDDTYWQDFVSTVDSDAFLDISGDKSADNEWRAHFMYRRTHGGNEALLPDKDLDIRKILSDIDREMRFTKQPIIVQVGGRSGSGKSTVVNDIVQDLAARNVYVEVISTDDYHRGATWLKDLNNGIDWNRWDDAVVYDTKRLAHDIAALKSGRSISRLQFDFVSAEPKIVGDIKPAQVLLIEGIYANSPDLASHSQLIYEVPASLATCLGRRLLRDLRERPEFSDPQKSLLYYLEQAEPSYRAQKSI